MSSLKILERFPLNYLTFQNHDIKSFCWSWLREINLSIPNLNYKSALYSGTRNLVLENWDGFYKRGFTPEYCENKNIRFAVILSEHLTFRKSNTDVFEEKIPDVPLKNIAKHFFSLGIENEVDFNNFSKTSSNISSDFTHRTKLLKEYDRFVDFYCTIGDLPRLETWANFLKRPQSDFIKIPINKKGLKKTSKFDINSKILFTGQVTSYRSDVISDLIKIGLDIEVFPINSFQFNEKSPFFVNNLNDEMKNELYKKFDYILDIPKDIDWPYSSTIRILDALRQDTDVIVANTVVDATIKEYTTSMSEYISKLKLAG